jgi:hypothetical protein
MRNVRNLEIVYLTKIIAKFQKDKFAAGDNCKNGFRPMPMAPLFVRGETNGGYFTLGSSSQL